MPRSPRSLLHAGVVLFTVLATLVQILPQDPQDATAPFPRRGEYVGSARCIECHKKREGELRAGHHGGILDAGLEGCETCHGPGKKHSDDEDNDPLLITFPQALDKLQQVAFCGRCHGEQSENHRGDLQGLLEAGKKCSDCHTVHKAKAVPHAGVHFRARTDSNIAEPVGSARCVECHPLRDRRLAASAHHTLASAADPAGCEGCHGNGSLHAATNGIARLITRADRAADGIATCRKCHEAVDPVKFHWRDRQPVPSLAFASQPLLTSGVTCTTCHFVHQPKATLEEMREWPEWRDSRSPVTNRTCARCHEPALCVLQGTVHDSLGRLDTPLHDGCAVCHPGAEAHALSGGRKQLISSLRGKDAKEQQATCLKCHQDERTLAHVDQGSHRRNNVGCLACHSPAERRGHVAEDAERSCRKCHADVAAQFQQPNHHPVPEGRMYCSSCHDVHGARPRIRNLALTQDSCVKCHRAYRGPFVFAHQAGRQDGCIACHVPHGTSNRRLLLQTNSQQNCIACHADWPSFHDQTPGAVFVNCMNCHTEVHGSNHSRFFFR
jgi:DmsE family decaheme c-type cytochrome